MLYGLNGAGEQVLLMSLRSCLHGDAELSLGDSDVVVRVSANHSNAEPPAWLVEYAAEWADLREKRAAWTPGTSRLRPSFSCLRWS